MNRREFLQTGAGAASGLLLLKPATAFGYAANSAVRIGLLGCGNRGTAVASSFTRSTTAQVVALADLFPDQLAAGHSHFDELNTGSGRAKIDPRMLFRGPHAFEQLAASPGRRSHPDLDATVLPCTAPPCGGDVGQTRVL